MSVIPYVNAQQMICCANVELRCQGRDCMAWRKIETKEFTRKANNEYQKTGKILVPDTGYCGLAGKPEIE